MIGSMGDRMPRLLTASNCHPRGACGRFTASRLAYGRRRAGCVFAGEVLS